MSGEFSPFKIVITLAIVISSTLFTYYLPQQEQLCSLLNDFIFDGIKVNFANEQSKWILVRALVLRLSTFVFLHASVAMLLRITFGYSSPVTKQDPVLIKMLNKIIQNTIQQSFIFLGLFTYFLLDGSSQKISAVNILNLATWFIVGRVLFSIGYSIGTIIRFQQLRSFGFGLTVLVNVVLLENIFFPEQIISKYFLN